MNEILYERSKYMERRESKRMPYFITVSITFWDESGQKNNI